MRARDRADEAAGEAEKAVDEVAKDCAICEEPILAGTEYTVADYGPVHTEPCSHQGRSAEGGIPLV